MRFHFLLLLSYFFPGSIYPMERESTICYVQAGNNCTDTRKLHLNSPLELSVISNTSGLGYKGCTAEEIRDLNHMARRLMFFREKMLPPRMTPEDLSACGIGVSEGIKGERKFFLNDFTSSGKECRWTINEGGIERATLEAVAWKSYLRGQEWARDLLRVREEKVSPIVWASLPSQALTYHVTEEGRIYCIHDIGDLTPAEALSNLSFNSGTNLVAGQFTIYKNKLPGSAAIQESLWKRFLSLGYEEEGEGVALFVGKNSQTTDSQNDEGESGPEIIPEGTQVTDDEDLTLAQQLIDEAYAEGAMTAGHDLSSAKAEKNDQSYFFDRKLFSGIGIGMGISGLALVTFWTAKKYVWHRWFGTQG